MSTLGPTEQAFLVEGLSDWVGLWRFARDARDEDPGASADEIRERVLHSVRRLILGGYVKAGNLTKEPPGFSEWQENPDDAVARIDREWRMLDRDPNIPDICWFMNTELGNDVARASTPDVRFDP